MELERLTQLVGLTNCIVKNFLIKGNEIVIEVERTGFPVCPKCGQLYFDAPKDRRSQRVEDLSAFGKRCFLIIEKYRIECGCGYEGNEAIEWLNRYARVTVRFQKWIYAFCKRMTGIDVAKVFGVSKYLVYNLDKEGIEKELAKQEAIVPTKISIDEISRKKGHRYATIISAPENRKILDVVKGRKSADLVPFFKGKGKKWCDLIELASMDAWKAFRGVVTRHCKNAEICFDHFHLAQHFSKAIDKLRVQEARKASTKNNEVYHGTRWLLLRNPENLKEEQKPVLERLLSLNKKLFTAYVLRDRFREIFNGLTAHSRLIRLTLWKEEARSARIGLISEFLNKIERWEPFIRNSLRHNYSNAFAEGLNNKVRVIQRMAYGYKDFDYLRLKIIQQFNFKGVHSVFDQW
jgi:transposase